MGNATTLKLGAINGVTGAFGAHPASPTNAVIDLNDGATFSLADQNGQGNGFDWGKPAPEVLKTSNPRVMGERLTIVNFRTNRMMKAHLFLGPTATYTTFIAAIRDLEQLCNSITPAQPAALQIQVTTASTPVYATVLEAHLLVAYNELVWMQYQDPFIEIDFECMPLLAGSRTTLSNLVQNPGFEEPGGTGAIAFNDALANFNSYTVQSGGALAQDTYQFPDTLRNLYGANLQRYYRLDESSGTTAFDVQINQSGTISATGVTLGTAGLLNGDSDTAMTFASASSGVIGAPSTGLPNTSAAFTYGIMFRINSLASATQYFMSGGTNVAKEGWYLGVSAANVAQAGVIGTNIAAGGAITTGVRHQLILSWDGTTLQAFLDGTSLGTATPGALSITYPSPSSNQGAWIGAFIGGAANFFNGILDEAWMAGVSTSSGNATTLWNAANTVPSATTNTMVIPLGGRVSFGSPVWGAINTWQIRFRFLTAQGPQFFIHYTDSNNQLYVQYLPATTTWQIVQRVAGTAHVLASGTVTLINGIQYWIRITQFPAFAAAAAAIQAVVLEDNAGIVGSQMLAIAPIVTFDGVTALMGQPQIGATGANLPLGGNYNAVHQVQLFGPGGWTFGNGGTVTCPGAWDQNSSNTVTGAAVTSYGAARIDIGATGTVNCNWNLYGGGTSSTIPAIPVNASGQTLAMSVYAKATSNLSVTAVISIVATEYDGSGTALRNGTVATLAGTGLTIPWTQLSGMYTTGTGCIYVDMACKVVDGAGASNGATVWFDNAQCYNQTTTGLTSMPYCEMRFTQAPTQLVLTGILGDIAAPAALAFGTYFTNWAAGSTMNWWLGRRGSVSQSAQLVNKLTATSNNYTPILDSTAWGGWYLRNSSAVTSFGLVPMLPNQPMAQLLGTYHIFYRLWSNQTTGNIGNVTGRVGQVETTFTPGGFTGYSSYNPILAAGSTWTVVDGGQINVPYANVGLLRDPATVTVSQEIDVADSTGGGSIFQLDWGTVVPVDADILLGVANNPSNASTLTNEWLWCYADGLNQQGPAWVRSIESYSIPNEAHAMGGVGSQSSGYISVNPTGDAYLMVDPNQRINGVSVNQIVGILADGAGAVLPLFCEIQYVPLYLYPK